MPEQGVRIGSLFSGAGGLDMAVEQVFGGTVAWQCEFNGAASKVLAHRYPGVPNFGDVTAIDWDATEPVDVMCGGYPCQPFSAAGQRKGTNDERHLWPYFAEAIRRVRPRHVVLENVAGHRSMGFDCVLGDLACLGYDAQWCSVRASDVGAPHRRERVFILAVDANTYHAAIDGQWTRQEPWRGSSDVADPESHGRDEGRPESARLEGRSDAAVGGDGSAADSAGERGADFPGGGDTPGQSVVAVAGAGDRNSARGAATRGELMGRATRELAAVDLQPGLCAHCAAALRRAISGQPSLDGDDYCPDPNVCDTSITDLLPTPRRSDGDGGANPLSRAERMDDVETRIIRLLQTPSSADGGGGHLNRSGARSDEPLLPGQAREMHGQQWGKYAPAIHRWESVTRSAPSPTEPNTRGNPRLAAPFPEWMMGWPAGWVTEVPGISRNDQLRIIGNGVCPQQAIAALRWLLRIVPIGVAA